MWYVLGEECCSCIMSSIYFCYWIFRMKVQRKYGAYDLHCNFCVSFAYIILSSKSGNDMYKYQWEMVVCLMLVLLVPRSSPLQSSTCSLYSCWHIKKKRREKTMQRKVSVKAKSTPNRSQFSSSSWYCSTYARYYSVMNVWWKIKENKTAVTKIFSQNYSFSDLQQKKMTEVYDSWYCLKVEKKSIIIPSMIYQSFWDSQRSLLIFKDELAYSILFLQLK